MYQFVDEGGWNTIEAEVTNDSLEITVYSTTCGTQDDSAGISIPQDKAREFAKWLLKHFP